MRPIRRPARYTISLLDLELRPANTDDRAGTLPVQPRLAALGFQGDLLGDSAFKGTPFAAAALGHDIHVSVSPGGTRDGRFLPSGIRWVVERLFAWLSRYRRLNVVYDRAPDLFAAHIWIAVASIISRRLVAEKASPVHSSGASVRPARSVVDLRTPVASRTRGTSCGPGL